MIKIEAKKPCTEGGLRRAVEKELTGKVEEASELIYFKVYKSQVPVIEQAIETAAGDPTQLYLTLLQVLARRTAAGFPRNLE